MAHANRRRVAWFAVLVVAAVALAIRSCATDEPAAAGPSALAAASPSSETPPASPRPSRSRDRAAEDFAPATTDVERAIPQPPAAEPRRGPNLFEVRVLRADGTPAVGALVGMRAMSLWNEWPEPLMWALRTTDAEGRTRLPPGNRSVLVQLGTEVGWTRKPGSVNPLPDVRLKPGVVVRGRAVDQNGMPVAEAMVRAETSPPFAGPVVVETRANANGEFELPPLPSDGDGQRRIEIVARAEGLAPGYAWTQTAEAPVVVQLFRGGALRGRLVSADGRPVTRGRVLLARTQIAAFPDENGRFTLRVPRRGGEVIAQDALIETPESEVRAAPGAWFAPRRLATFHGDSGDRDLGDVVVGPGAPCRGVVVDTAGAAVANAQVSVAIAGAEVLSVRTDARGAFEFPLSEDEHELTVHDPWRDGWSPRKADVQGVRSGRPELRVVLGGGGIVVRLRAVDGTKIAKALRGVTVHASPREAPDRDYGHAGHAGELDALRVSTPTPGAWDVKVTAEGYEPAAVGNVAVAAERDTEIEVRLVEKR